MTREDLAELQTHHTWQGVPVVLLDSAHIKNIMDNANRIYNQNAGRADTCPEAREHKCIAGGVIVYFGERYFKFQTPGRVTFKNQGIFQ